MATAQLKKSRNMRSSGQGFIIRNHFCVGGKGSVHSCFSERHACLFFLSLFLLGSGCGESGLTMKTQSPKEWESKRAFLLRRETPTLDKNCLQLAVSQYSLDSTGDSILNLRLLKTFIEAVGPDHPSWRMKDQNITTDDTQLLPPQSILNAPLISDGDVVRGSFLKCNLVGLHFQSRHLEEGHHDAQVWDIYVLESSWGMEEGIEGIQMLFQPRWAAVINRLHVHQLSLSLGIHNIWKLVWNLDGDWEVQPNLH